MAHRYNTKTGRVEPKPSARERTWYRWRMRNGMETPQDTERISKLQVVKEYIRTKILGRKEKEDKEK